MSTRELLSGDELTEAMVALDGWSVGDDKLRKEFTFSDFVEAFGFMASAALCAERSNHHPEWSNVYNRVVVELSTHDAGGITPMDIALAADMDRLAGA